MFNPFLINKFKTLETPFYHYDITLLRNTLTKVKQLADTYNFDVHYALKANCNNRILREVSNYGFGADCVSGNEVATAIKHGFAADKVLFAGVGKTDKEIELALSHNIEAFNCESIQEILVINELAEKHNKTAKIALRVNPDVDAKTHKHITTGLNENKFGINQKDLIHNFELIKGLSHICITGTHFHIGSQITDMNVFEKLCLRINEIQTWFEQYGIEISDINVGGGLGVNYEEPDKEPMPDFEHYFAVFNQFLQRRTDQKVHFELGRSLVAQCGNLISRVVYTKPGVNTEFVILDAGMTELMRPALYQSYHKIDNLSAAIDDRCSAQACDFKQYHVVGPICESTDCFGQSVNLPSTQRGDVIAIRSAGAYGEVMFSNYNLRDKNLALCTED